MIFPASAGKLETAFKALEVHDYFKARTIFRKEVKKHPAAAWYGLSVISGRADNPFFDLDSAYQFILKADLAFTEAPDKERVTIGNYGVSHTTIEAQRTNIHEQAWGVAKGQNTVSAYKSFLDRYPAGLIAASARRITSPSSTHSRVPRRSTSPSSTHSRVPRRSTRHPGMR